MNLTLRNVYESDGEPRWAAVVLLHRLLAERPPEANISHSGKLPSIEEHERFVRSNPYRFWFVIAAAQEVGAIYATAGNEIGIFIFKDHQERGYATAAIQEFMRLHDPLPIGRRQWLANVAPKNWKSKVLFEKLGGHICQLTYELPRRRTDV